MEKNEILRSKKLYLFDMDGTLYLGSRLYDFTLELLSTLKKTGRKYLFMTNNSSRSVEDYVKKLKNLGISKEETCVVGDRIYTDVKSGLNAGITGILVLSGETTREMLEESADKPHLVLEDASEILDAIK